MSQCYDSITILYEGEIHIVDPFTIQTYPDALIQNCSDGIKNLFRLDKDQEDSWYTLTPVYHSRIKLLYLDLKRSQVTPVTAQTLTGSQDASMNTRSQLRGFRNDILINAASRTALKKISQNLTIYSTLQERSHGSTITPEELSSMLIK